VKVLIATVGSQGDVQPYVALGKALVAAGHAASVCAPLHFESLVRGHGLDYQPMDNGFIELMATLEARTALEDMGSLPGAIRTIIRLVPKTGELQRRLFEDTWAAARAVQPDLLLFHPKIGIGPDIGHQLGIPAVLAPMFPQYVRTNAFPAVGLPDWPLGRGYRRGTYAFVHGVGAWASRKPVRAWRESEGLGSRPGSMGPFTRADGSAVPVLHGFSPLLCPVPADWPPQAVAFGDWPLETAADFQPEPALAEFLAAGPPPVYIGFGSMSGRSPAKKAAIVIEAVQRAGVRALIGRGWGGLDPGELPPEIFALGQVPHDWLFPRTAAVVHHGGAGTTHAGLRAGRPTVICPFFGDQPFWARRVQALGVGPAPVPQSKLSVERLSAAITQATTQEDMATRAAEFGAKLRAEDGLLRSVAWLEKLLPQR
tara:strand:+ start:9356 stop:10636 length:1281 start_codon:yes stop_codon:yes gene_type:complete